MCSKTRSILVVRERMNGTDGDDDVCSVAKQLKILILFHFFEATKNLLRRSS